VSIPSHFVSLPHRNPCLELHEYQSLHNMRGTSDTHLTLTPSLYEIISGMFRIMGLPFPTALHLRPWDQLSKCCNHRDDVLLLSDLWGWQHAQLCPRLLFYNRTFHIFSLHMIDLIMRMANVQIDVRSRPCLKDPRSFYFFWMLLIPPTNSPSSTIFPQPSQIPEHQTPHLARTQTSASATWTNNWQNAR